MSTTTKTILDVSGMSCGSCVRHINAALGALDGVKNVDVRLGEGKVIVEHAAVPSSLLIEALADAGYEGSVSS